MIYVVIVPFAHVGMRVVIERHRKQHSVQVLAESLHHVWIEARYVVDNWFELVFQECAVVEFANLRQMLVNGDLRPCFLLTFVFFFILGFYFVEPKVISVISQLHQSFNLVFAGKGLPVLVSVAQYLHKLRNLDPFAYCLFNLFWYGKVWPVFFLDIHNFA